MRAELWTDTGDHMGSFDLPPFNNPPDVLFWQGIPFVRFGPTVHLHTCNMLSGDPKPHCNCEGVFAFERPRAAVSNSNKAESGKLAAIIDAAEKKNATHTLQDAHAIEATRARPITKPRGKA